MQRFRAILERKTRKFAGGVNRETSRQIRDTIAEGIANGDPLDKIIRSIESGYAFSKTRASTIAITEVKRTQMLSQIEAWDHSGVVEGKVWYTALDDRVDETLCAPLHGISRSLGWRFKF